MWVHKGKTALITGAASGIGAELTRLFAADGYQLVLVDKNGAGLELVKKQLQAAGPVHATCLVQDLALQDAAQTIFQALQEQSLVVDVLVNNAGFGTFGNFWEIDLERDKSLVNVNILAPVLLTKLLLPGMVQRGAGKILNVGSVSGFSASPYATTYYSSKAFLLAFSTGLHSSLDGTGVTCTVVCPGPTHTAFDWREPGGEAAPVARKPLQMLASDVATIGYRGMLQGKAIVVPGWSNKTLALLAKFMPRSVALKLVKKGQTTVNQ